MQKLRPLGDYLRRLADETARPHLQSLTGAYACRCRLATHPCRNWRGLVPVPSWLASSPECLGFRVLPRKTRGSVLPTSHVQPPMCCLPWSAWWR